MEELTCLAVLRWIVNSMLPYYNFKREYNWHCVQPDITVCVGLYICHEGNVLWLTWNPGHEMKSLWAIYPMINNGWHWSYHCNELYMSLCIILTKMNGLLVQMYLSCLSCLYQVAARTGAKLLHSGNLRLFDLNEMKTLWAIYPYDWLWLTLNLSLQWLLQWLQDYYESAC